MLHAKKLLCNLQAVLATSGEVPQDTPTINGWDFDNGRDLDGIMGAMLHSGIQATSLGRAVNEINRMVRMMHHCYLYMRLLPRPYYQSNKMPFNAQEDMF